MSWDDYQELGPHTRGEYLDGALVMAPAPGRRHQEICFRLMTLLKQAIGDRHVTGGWGWQPCGAKGLLARCGRLLPGEAAIVDPVCALPPGRPRSCGPGAQRAG